MNTNKYQFDDERGNNFNITVNHYHSVQQQNPLQSISNMIAQSVMMKALSSSFSNSNNENNLIEDEKYAQNKRNVVLIENEECDGFSYEIKDENNFDFEITNLSQINNVSILSITFDKEIDYDTFLKNYDKIGGSILIKLSTICSKNENFIFKFNMKRIGEFICGYSRTDFFTSLINKFGNGKNRVSFNHKVGEKLKTPLLNYLSNLNYIIDIYGLFKIKFESIDSKYHISKEGENDGNKYL